MSSWHGTDTLSTAVASCGAGLTLLADAVAPAMPEASWAGVALGIVGVAGLAVRGYWDYRREGLEAVRLEAENSTLRDDNKRLWDRLCAVTSKTPPAPRD